MPGDPTLHGRRFFMGNWNMAGFLHEGREIRTLSEVLKRLKEAYCGTIGYEYMHIPDRERCNWLRERIETPEKVCIRQMSQTSCHKTYFA